MDAKEGHLAEALSGLRKQGGRPCLVVALGKAMYLLAQPRHGHQIDSAWMPQGVGQSLAGRGFVKPKELR